MRALVCSSLLEPTRLKRPSWVTRSSLACSGGDMSADLIQEDGAVVGPSKRPIRCAAAPVKAPFSWPNSSLSSRVSGIAAQLTLTSGPDARGAPGVDHIGQHFLADAAFAGDQDAAFGGGDQRGIVEDGLHQRASGHDVRRQLLVGAELQRARAW